MGKDGSVKKVLAAVALVALALACVSCGGGEARKTSLDTEIEKASYAYGMDVAASMQRSGLELDVDSFVQGFRDTLTGGKVLLSNQEKMQVMQEYAAKMREKQMAEMEAAAVTNLEEGQAFLDQNAAREGVIKTASGLQYEVIQKGDGPRPQATDRVKVNYTGTLIDGTKFDSSFDRGQPAEFPLNGVISGWTEALQLMNVGSTYRIYVPPDLAYRERGAPPVIGPNATLIFDIELLEIIK
ncbi:MAG: FKBP-type peptidyl-prolyl cis-trans isomerase [Candidatus Eisenbacteria bacterium]|nr:FKBP-type peptidyl-prolyl cis-trans isomerase [Candidatus Eisenbacteria bacterium]